MPAPKGNRNAAKEAHGLRGEFWLSSAHVAVLDELLMARGEEPCDTARRDLARELLRRAVADVARAQEAQAAIIV